MFAPVAAAFTYTWLLIVTGRFVTTALTPLVAVMVLPALVGFIAFYAWPAWRAVEISFTEWNLLRPPRDVGWANYRQLWDDGRFWHGLKLSGLYALMNIPIQTALGLGLAVAMHRLTQSMFVRSVVLLPYLLSNVLVAMIWLWMLDPASTWKAPQKACWWMLVVPSSQVSAEMSKCPPL